MGDSLEASVQRLLQRNQALRQRTYERNRALAEGILKGRPLGELMDDVWPEDRSFFDAELEGSSNSALDRPSAEDVGVSGGSRDGDGSV